MCCKVLSLFLILWPHLWTTIYHPRGNGRGSFVMDAVCTQKNDIPLGAFVALIINLIWTCKSLLKLLTAIAIWFDTNILNLWMSVDNWGSWKLNCSFYMTVATIKGYQTTTIVITTIAIICQQASKARTCTQKTILPVMLAVHALNLESECLLLITL